MVLRKSTTRTFHRKLYGGQLETITLYKRGDDQQAGTVRTLTLFECRWKPITKTGQIVQGDNTSNHRREVVIPRSELDRVGVAYISAGDRFLDKQGRTWQTEANLVIEVRLFENFIGVQCFRTDPPRRQ